ncbi:MAG: hypothetical protein FWC20_09105 [Oscillospiraceae bacterium]|nr:hypothetical protein [Oscillospiraceae bacterium]
MKKGMKLLRNMIIGLLVVICAVAAVVVVITVFGDGNEATMERRPVERVRATGVVHEAEDSLNLQTSLQRRLGESYWRYYPSIPDEAMPGDIVNISVPALGFVAWEAESLYSEVKIMDEISTADFIRASFVVPEEAFAVRALYTDTFDSGEGVFIFNYEAIEEGQAEIRPDATETVYLRYGMFENDYRDFITFGGIGNLEQFDFRVEDFYAFIGDAAGVGAHIHGLSARPGPVLDGSGRGVIVEGFPSGQVHDYPLPPDAPPRVVTIFTFDVVMSWAIEEEVEPERPNMISNPNFDPDLPVGPGNPEQIQDGTIPAVRELVVNDRATRRVQFTILPQPIIRPRIMQDGMVGVQYGGTEAHGTRIGVDVLDLLNPNFPDPPVDLDSDDPFERAGLIWRWGIIHDTDYYWPNPPKITDGNPQADILIRPNPLTPNIIPPTSPGIIPFTLELLAFAPHPEQNPTILRHIGTVRQSFEITILPRPEFVTGSTGLAHTMDATLRFTPELMEENGVPMLDSSGHPIVIQYNEPHTRLLVDDNDVPILNAGGDFVWLGHSLATPENQQGHTYQQTIRAKGFHQNIDWNWSYDTLPAGLQFDRSPGSFNPVFMGAEGTGGFGEDIFGINGTPRTFGTKTFTVTYDSMNDDNLNVRVEIPRTFTLIIWPRTYLHINMGAFQRGFVRQMGENGIADNFNENIDSEARMYMHRHAVMPGNLGMISFDVGSFVRWEHEFSATQHSNLPPIGGPSSARPTTAAANWQQQTGHFRTPTHNHMVMRMPVTTTTQNNVATYDPDNHFTEVFIRGFTGIEEPYITLEQGHGEVGRTFDRSLQIRAQDIGVVGGTPPDNRPIFWEIISHPEIEYPDHGCGINLSIDPDAGRTSTLTEVPTRAGIYTFTIGVNLRGTMRIDRTFSVIVNPRPDVMLGDVNNDRVVNLADFMLLARAVRYNDMSYIVNFDNANVVRDFTPNGDHNINRADVDRLAEFFANTRALPEPPDLNELLGD